jgi:hypothetical protein
MFDRNYVFGKMLESAAAGLQIHFDRKKISRKEVCQSIPDVAPSASSAAAAANRIT